MNKPCQLGRKWSENARCQSGGWQGYL